MVLSITFEHNLQFHRILSVDSFSSTLLGRPFDVTYFPYLSHCKYLLSVFPQEEEDSFNWLVNNLLTLPRMVIESWDFDQKRFYLSYETFFPFEIAKFLPSANSKNICERSGKLGFFNQIKTCEDLPATRRACALIIMRFYFK